MISNTILNRLVLTMYGLVQLVNDKHSIIVHHLTFLLLYAA